MERVCQQKSGLFPSPNEIELSCSCPDWADMCKHVAAVLYGIGARLDQQPELLFRLHKVDERELIARAGNNLPLAKMGRRQPISQRQRRPLRTLWRGYGEEHGVQWEARCRRAIKAEAKEASKPMRRKVSPAMRKKMAEAARARWAARKADRDQRQPKAPSPQPAGNAYRNWHRPVGHRRTRNISENDLLQSCGALIVVPDRA